MKLILLLAFIMISSLSKGQIRTITGKVIDENLERIPEVRIQNRDTIQLATTDINGGFKMDIPYDTNELLLSWIGMEWTTIKVPMNCHELEIIMMVDGHYDYSSHRKIDRLRKKRFNKLPKLHAEAVTKGIFVSASPCFTREFQPYKSRLDQIRRRLMVKRKQIKESFEELAIGDTIRIPYSGSYRSDGTDRTTLSVWSYTTDTEEFDCIIEGIVVDKNKRNKGYNIVYKVTNTDSCKYDSIIYNGKNMSVGEVFEHNVKYFKLLKN